MASDMAINRPCLLREYCVPLATLLGMGIAVTRTPCQAGWITVGRLGRRHNRSWDHTESQLTETAWPDMARLAFTLSLCRPHTHNADTCMQGFPGIICPAFCSASQVTSFLVSPPPHTHTHATPVLIQRNTNVQPYTNICMLMFMLSFQLFHHWVYPLLVFLSQCRCS